MPELVLRYPEAAGLPVLLDDAPGGYLREICEIASKALGTPLDLLPLAPASLESGRDRDLLVLTRQDQELGQQVRCALGLPPCPSLREEGYQVETVAGPRRALVVTGARLRGLLFGWAHVRRLLKPSPEGLSYLGGDLREEPAFQQRTYWTWDHRCTWDLGHPGAVDSGCHNEYMKDTEGFLADYEALFDYMLESRFNSVLIWGFLREAHGGVAAGRHLCEQARKRDLFLLPTFGTNYYGGFFYRGRHPFNTDTRAALHPEALATHQTYCPPPEIRNDVHLCTTHPGNLQWAREGTRWLLDTFDLSGIALEYGDFLYCECDRCEAARAAQGSQDPPYYQDTMMAQEPVLEEVYRRQPEAWVSFATYTGFLPGTEEKGLGWPGEEPPGFVRDLDPRAMCMWTVSGMVHNPPVPLSAWLQDGEAPQFYDNPSWPRGLTPPTAVSGGLLHTRRSMLDVSRIKEACLRGAESGLTGIFIYGEVTSRCVPAELNYLAASHFSYHPRASLYDFAEAQLAPLVGGLEKSRFFVEVLAQVESGSLTEEQDERLRTAAADAYARLDRYNRASDGGTTTPDYELTPAERVDLVATYRRWQWLRGWAAGSVPSYLSYP
jgi:hypothetical protein